MFTVWILAAIALLSVAIAARRSRKRRVDRLRTEWGKPASRTLRLDAMAESHASRVAVTHGRSLDARTWADLNLDDVLSAIDRTESTLGQHALYHRLRTTPVADHLDAFEALVNRMSRDAATRERAQLALARLQDPHGYDLWWLGRPNAIAPRAWYGVFPALSVAAVVSVAVAPVWPGALLAVVVVNLLVRYATDRQIGAIARSFL